METELKIINYGDTIQVYIGEYLALDQPRVTAKDVLFAMIEAGIIDCDEDSIDILRD